VSKLKKIGLYFGSFNPIHIGHLIIANHLVEHTNLDEVWFMVTPHNPHKEKKTLLADIHRLELVRRAVEDYSKLKASNLEFDLPQPSYTVNTLAYIKEKHPDYSFSLIMGEDNLKSFPKWKNYETILKYYNIYVYPRISQLQIPDFLVKHSKIHYVDAPIIELSATAIRKAIQANKNIRPLVPLAVWQYMDEMNFYK
jgi:nicotinate-nucleotide adenylyltransferase